MKKSVISTTGALRIGSPGDFRPMQNQHILVCGDIILKITNITGADKMYLSDG